MERQVWLQLLLAHIVQMDPELLHSLSMKLFQIKFNIFDPYDACLTYS